MNADEARRKALEINTNAINSQYAEIKKRISKAVLGSETVSGGKYQLFVYEYILPDVQTKLESEGFIIGDNTGRYNDTTIKISW